MIGAAAPVAARVRDAAMAIDGVAGLHAGTFGDVATYLPGQRVSGVRIGKAGVEVHVIVHFGTDIRQVAQAVRGAAAAQLDRPLPCTVVVEDVVPAVCEEAGPAVFEEAGPAAFEEAAPTAPEEAAPAVTEETRES